MKIYRTESAEGTIIIRANQKAEARKILEDHLIEIGRDDLRRIMGDRLQLDAPHWQARVIYSGLEK